MVGYAIYFNSLIISLIVAAALAVFFWRRRPAPGARAAAWLTGAVIICLIAYIAEQLTSTLADRQIIYDFLYIGLVSGPAFWFIFTIRFTRYDSWFIRRPYLIWIIPFITLVLTWTNSLHGWMWHDAYLKPYGGYLILFKTYGFWFYIHAIYSYGLIIAGLIWLVIRLSTTIHLYRAQLYTLLVCIIFPLIWNVIYVFRAPPTYQIDLTPQAFIVSGLVMALGLFRLKLLNIVPIARNTLVENLNEGVLVLDAQNRIIDLNQAAQKLIGKPAADLLARSPDLLWAVQPELKQLFFSNVETRKEVYWNNDNNRYYELNIIPLYDKKHLLNGRLVVLRDLTQRKQMEQTLEDYANRITQIQEEERQRVARELHDDTAQALAILSLELDSLVDSKEITSIDVKDKLRHLRNSTNRAMQDVRRYSHELRPGVLDYLGLEAALEQLVDESDGLHDLKVNFENHGGECKIPKEVELAFFRIAQEALNNTRKHAQASEVDIKLECSSSGIELVIADNGRGFDPKTSESAAREGHMGLIGMKERAQLIGASLKIESESGKGTSVIVSLSQR